MWRTVFIVIGLSVATIFSAQYFKSSPALPNYGAVPAFSLYNQDGQSFGSEQLKNKVWVISFFFSRCGMVCPVVNAKLSGLQKRIVNKSPTTNNVRFVSVSIDPEYDSVEVLAKYKKKFSEWTPAWNFLTGDEAIITALNHDTFKFDTLDELDQHTTRFVLIDQTMRIRGYYASEDSDAMNKLEADIVSLQ